MKSKEDRGKLLARYRQEYRDPYAPQYYTAMTVSVYAPNLSRPFATVLVSWANAGGRVLVRFRSIEEVPGVFYIPSDEVLRLSKAVGEANRRADILERDMKVMFDRRHLPDGVGLARTDTGEIVAEAEKIIKEAQG